MRINGKRVSEYSQDEILRMLFRGYIPDTDGENTLRKLTDAEKYECAKVYSEREKFTIYHDTDSIKGGLINGDFYFCKETAD